jgi:F-type H+-transporting ATPase subunit epsilon
MAATFLLEVVTPERLFVRENVTEAQIPAKDGYIGILPGHAALVSGLGAGVLSYVCDGRLRSLRVNGGWIEICDDHARVLADSVEKPAE